MDIVSTVAGLISALFAFITQLILQKKCAARKEVSPGSPGGRELEGGGYHFHLASP